MWNIYILYLSSEKEGDGGHCLVISRHVTRMSFQLQRDQLKACHTLYNIMVFSSVQWTTNLLRTIVQRTEIGFYEYHVDFVLPVTNWERSLPFFQKNLLSILGTFQFGGFQSLNKAKRFIIPYRIQKREEMTSWRRYIIIGSLRSK